MPKAISYLDDPAPPAPVVNEHGIKDAFIGRLRALKYTHRPDLHDRMTFQHHSHNP